MQGLNEPDDQEIFAENEACGAVREFLMFGGVFGQSELRLLLARERRGYWRGYRDCYQEWEATEQLAEMDEKARKRDAEKKAKPKGAKPKRKAKPK